MSSRTNPAERHVPPCYGQHWWYWVTFYTLKCKKCGTVKFADR